MAARPSRPRGVGRGRPALSGRPGRGLPACIAACVAGFAAIAVDVTHDGPFDRADHHLAGWAAGRPAELHSWASRLTHLGDRLLLAALVALAVVYLLSRRRRLDAVLLCAAGASAGLLTTLLKDAFRRSRPPFVDQAAAVHSFSFPSGHASGASAVYVLLALLLTAGLGRAWRAAALAASFGLVALVGATRVLIPVHYLSDVVAGSAVGLAAASTAWLVRLVIGRRR